MAEKKLVLTIKKNYSERIHRFVYSLYVNDVVISESCSPSWLVGIALQMYFCDPQIYVLGIKLSSIYKSINASFDD